MEIHYHEEEAADASCNSSVQGLQRRKRTEDHEGVDARMDRMLHSMKRTVTTRMTC